jgi:quercetin dioxygenase-like cupin family protein
MTRQIAIQSAIVLIALALLGAGPAQAEGMEVIQPGSRPPTVGSSEFFTGHVVVDTLFDATRHAGTAGGEVTFAPGARSAWHTHPGGQTLIVTTGIGWVQEWGGEKREIKPGDVIWTPPGVKHWHGATASDEMSHIAITEAVDGMNVAWLEKVSDEQYSG